MNMSSCKKLNGYVVKEGSYRIVKDDGKFVASGTGANGIVTIAEFLSVDEAMKYGRANGLRMFRSERKVYWVLSGEGEIGTWERHVCTELGIKRILTSERRGGDRWARAVCDFYVNQYDEVVGLDAEDGTTVTVTQDAADDVK